MNNHCVTYERAKINCFIMIFDRVCYLSIMLVVMNAVEVVMGLLDKLKNTGKNSDDLPDYVDSLLENSKTISNEEIDERFSVKNMALNIDYGIDHAIDLMRSLPSDNTNIIVSVVTKTLESANINVSKIINDAETKEKALVSQIDLLSDEIKALQEQIEQKKEQINVSTAILGETRKVKGLLEASVDKQEQKPITRTHQKKPDEGIPPANDTPRLELNAHSA